MRKIRHLVAATAVTGLLALGGVAASTGAADAATHVSGCSKSGLATAGIEPTCSSSGSVTNPTSIKLTVNASFLNQLLNTPASLLGLGIKDRWSLSCWAGSRGIVSTGGVFTMTGQSIAGGNRNPSIWLLRNNQLPSKCTVSSTVTALGDLTLLGAGLITVGDNVTATTGAAGHMWSAAAGSGQKCASGPVTGSTRPGSKAVVWNCGPSTRWEYGPTGELSRNGVCLTNSAGRATLQNCAGKASQIWSAGARNTEVRSKNGGCLTMPSLRNGTQLRISRCTGKANQRWYVPPRARR